MGQSSNDVIPTAIHVSAALELDGRLLPALEHLAATIEAKAPGTVPRSSRPAAPT
jgi:fumarate hydratase, class II